ncbi:putative protein kinase UbiB [Candidatus Kinetoplastibacterium sorsogonicusi]|uniref:Protein kinase domain-containing protein n=1 Tax=Candidatus Kinetoplastidibacterium kentomonadis TaxID=1576550 RepID=A0A3S7J972_9PROT|nr:ubiquinone biosynthesis regulatory protein kinase UbiB [Candidatus Kinetoplastibacterium sorsogonicusi]AWD32206.1 putative protein kinase UbiB [Candidatus Kinetoplastibacterium sorsogonicusi]
MSIFYRILYIIYTFIKYRLDFFLKNKFLFFKIARLWKKPKYSRGVSLRLFFEDLGPIFIKFGQLLSTRGDLIPDDIIQELSLLQEKVPAFSSNIAIAIIEKDFNNSINNIFKKFDHIPIASASVAQVHSAITNDGTKVAVKIIRPNINNIISYDIKILSILSWVLEKFFIDLKRLRLRKIVKEFDKYIHDELDLIQEASNCSQLRKNFQSSKVRQDMLIVPKVFWDITSKNVFTMEFMNGIPINNIDKINKSGIDISKLAINGVKIFFTQVFFDGFFHADMHPGNIYVSNHPNSLGKYIAMDFGIVCTLSEQDKNYLAQNFLAFFQRNYKKVAQLHIESGWVPKNTREEELENSIRAVCEPYFDRPLSQISLGKLLLRLFMLSKRFNIYIQPQLILLQKTLLNIEGLGLKLDPSLDIWNIARPYLEIWMKEQIGLKGFLKSMHNESIYWSKFIPQVPRLLHKQITNSISNEFILNEIKEIKKNNKMKKILIILLLFLIFFK